MESVFLLFSETQRDLDLKLGPFVVPMGSIESLNRNFQVIFVEEICEPEISNHFDWHSFYEFLELAQWISPENKLVQGWKWVDL